MTVEVDVSKRCDHGCFYLSLGSDSQWHLPGAGTFSSPAEEMWIFHADEVLDVDCCECWNEDD